MKKVGKKSQANLITTVLIILIIIILMILLWNFLRIFLQKQSNKLIVDPVTTNVCVSYDVKIVGDCLETRFKRSLGEGTIVGWAYILRNSTKEIIIRDYNLSYVLEQQEERLIKICDYKSNITNVNRIAVVPLFRDKNGDDVYGKSTDFCFGDPRKNSGETIPPITNSKSERDSSNYIFLPIRECIGWECPHLDYCMGGTYHLGETWLTAFGFPGYSDSIVGFSSLYEAPSYGYIAAGSTNFQGNGKYRPYLTKLWLSGCPDLMFGINGFVDFPVSGVNRLIYPVFQTNDGNYIASGSSWTVGERPEHGWSDNDADCYAVKLDKKGTILWEKYYGNPNTKEMCLQGIVVNDRYILAGGINNTATGLINYYLVEIDLDGTIIRNKTFETLSGSAGGVYNTSDGGFMITSSGGRFVKLNSSWDVLWTYYNSSDPNYMTVAVEVSDGYVVTGTDRFWKAKLLKLSKNGNLIWIHSYEDLIMDALIQTKDGGFLMTGRTHANGDVYLVKTDSSGNEIWNRKYGGNIGNYSTHNNADWGKGAIQAPTLTETVGEVTYNESGYIVFSWTNSLFGGSTNADAVIFKINETGDCPQAQGNWSDFTFA